MNTVAAPPTTPTTATKRVRAAIAGHDDLADYADTVQVKSYHCPVSGRIKTTVSDFAESAEAALDAAETLAHEAETWTAVTHIREGEGVGWVQLTWCEPVPA